MENDPKINFAESIKKAGEKRLAISPLSFSLTYFNSFSTKNSATYFQVHGKAHFSKLNSWAREKTSANKSLKPEKKRKEKQHKQQQKSEKKGQAKSGHVTISSSTNRFCCNFYISGRLSQR